MYLLRRFCCYFSRHFLRYPLLLLCIICVSACSYNFSDMPLVIDEEAMHVAEDYSSMTIPQLQQAMDSNALSAEDLTTYFIQKINDEDARYHAVITISPDAIAQAQQRDAERRDGVLRGPLHGIPVLVKDNIETLRMPTTAGSLALAYNDPHRDAALITQLRANGAIILGKTNLSEWANFRSHESSSGWSSVRGQTRNVYDTSRSPCGSSSGSAVAVAAGFAVAAIGTEMDGSIVCPASMNGVIGLKPTRGMISNKGIVPLAKDMDTPGFFTTSLIDAHLLLNALRADGQQDVRTFAAQNLSGLRIGVLRSATGYHKGVDALFEQQIKQLETVGAVIVDDLKLEPYAAFYNDHYQLLCAAFTRDIDEYFASLRWPYNKLSLVQLIAFNRKNAATVMPYFDQSILLDAASSPALSPKAYQALLDKLLTATQKDGLDKLLITHQLDVLIAPTTTPAWRIDLVNGDNYLGGFSTYPAIAGYPHLTMPMGTIHDLPVGLSLVQLPGNEHQLLEIAAGMALLNND